MKKLLSLYGGLPRGIYILFIARIINRMGDFVHMFLTLFLTLRLGYSGGQTAFVLLLAGAAQTAGVLTGGKLADHLGRRGVMAGGQLATALLLIPCGFLGNSPLIPRFIIAACFFNGAVRPASGSALADLTVGEAQRKKAYSLIYLGTNLGVAVGPLIAGYLFRHHTPLIFWVDGATALFSAFLIRFFTAESRPDRRAQEESLRRGPHAERKVDGSAFRALMARPALSIFCLLAFFVSLVYSQSGFLIPLHLASLFSEESARLFGSLMSCNALWVLFVTPVLLKLTARRSAVSNMTATSLLYLLGFGMLRFGGSFPFFLVSTCIWTTGEVLMATNVSVYIANHSPINHRARFSSFMNTINAAGRMAGPFAAGSLSGMIGIPRTWLWVALLSGAAGAGFFLLGRRKGEVCEGALNRAG